MEGHTNTVSRDLEVGRYLVLEGRYRGEAVCAVCAALWQLQRAVALKPQPILVHAPHSLLPLIPHHLQGSMHP